MADRQITQELLEADVELEDPTLQVTQELLEADVVTDDANLRVSQLVHEVAIEGTGANVQVSQLVHEIALDSEATANVQVSQIVYEIAIYFPPPSGAAPTQPYPPTHQRSVSLPISLWRPIIGSYEPRGEWVGTVDQWDSYEHTIARLGGYWKASFTVSGDMADTDWWLDEGLGLHVEVHDEAQVLIWEGFVDEVEATIGPLTVRRGPLTEVANSIRVHYQEIDNTGTVTDDDDWEPAGATLDDTDSQARYGVLYQTFQADRLMTAEAQQVAAIYLAENAWPRTSKDWSLPGGSSPSVTVTCRGYAAFLDRYVYNNANAGVWDLDEKLVDILDADVANALFDSANADITPNALQVVKQEERERTAWEAIKSLVALGDGSNNRYSFGVYANRRVVYEPWPSEIEYRQRIADPHQRTENAAGLEVMPWNVLPGRWLMIPDLLIGRVPPDTPFASDPRVMMLREVTYRAPYELQLSQEDPDETEGRIAQIALRNQAW